MPANARDYPYDPKYDAFSLAELTAECQRLEGLDKLRTVAHRGHADALAVLYDAVVHREKRINPEAERKREEARELAEGERAIKAVLDGQAGEELRALTSEMFPKYIAITLPAVRKWRELRLKHASQESR